MPKKAHTEEQIVAALRQGEAGEKVGDICRKVGKAKGPTMPGKNSTPGWGSMSCVSCANCGKRTGV